MMHIVVKTPRLYRVVKGENGLKIHIVQKGDTLWKIAKAYDVDLEALKNMNHHIASPDMIMPGMKIKIPSKTESNKQTEAKEKSSSEAKEKIPKSEHMSSPSKQHSVEKNLAATPVKADEPLQSLQNMPELDGEFMSKIDLNAPPFLLDEQSKHTPETHHDTPPTCTSKKHVQTQQSTEPIHQPHQPTQVVPIFYPVYIPFPITSAKGEQHLKRINEHNEREISKYTLVPTNAHHEHIPSCTCHD